MRMRSLSLALLVATMSAFMARPSLGAGTWTVETITQDGQWPDAAYGPTGPGVAYTNVDGTDAVHYAYFDTSWHTELVSTEPVFYGTALPALAFDGVGKPWVFYDLLFPSQSVLRERTGPNTWVVALTIPDADPIDLVKSPDGHLGLLYIDGADTLVYGTYDGSTLTSSPIAEASSGSLAYQGTTPIVAFGDNTGGLSFAEREGSTWTIQQIDPFLDQRPSIALQPNGRAMIAYGVNTGFGETDGDLWLAKQRSEQWSSTLVQKRGDVGWEPSLSILPGPQILIANKALKQPGQARLRVVSYTGGRWSLDVIGDSNIMGHPSMVLDPSNVPHIAFAGVSELEWATRG
jgi:hypothetical protein